MSDKTKQISLDVDVGVHAAYKKAMKDVRTKTGKTMRLDLRGVVERHMVRVASRAESK